MLTCMYAHVPQTCLMTSEAPAGYWIPWNGGTYGQEPPCACWQLPWVLWRKGSIVHIQLWAFSPGPTFMLLGPPPLFENFLIKWKVLSFSSLKMSSPHLYSWGVTWHVTVNRLIIIFFQCVRDTPALASVCGYFRWWVSDGMNFWCAIFFWLLVRLFNFQ